MQNDIASLQEVSTSALMGKIPRNNKMNSSSSKYYENICILIDFVGYATKVSTTTSTNSSEMSTFKNSPNYFQPTTQSYVTENYIFQTSSDSLAAQCLLNRSNQASLNIAFYDLYMHMEFLLVKAKVKGW